MYALNSLLHHTCVTAGTSQKIESDGGSNRTAEVDTRSPNTERVMSGRNTRGSQTLHKNGEIKYKRLVRGSP